MACGSGGLERHDEAVADHHRLASHGRRECRAHLAHVPPGWGVEDSFKFTKDVLGWEEVQLLDFEGVRTLVALAWIAAGFLYELGITLEWEGVRLLARLGGWAERKDNRPGKIVLATQAFLESYREEHGALPPQIAAWLGETPPQEL